MIQAKSPFFEDTASSSNSTISGPSKYRPATAVVHASDSCGIVGAISRPRRNASIASSYFSSDIRGFASIARSREKATNVKQCLAVEVPAFVAFYCAGQDFKSDDRFELEVKFPAGRKQLQRFHVSTDTNNGQRI
jgi:hypothetical protein